MRSDPPFGLYLHIPFCERKCPYCDFNTYAGLESLHQEMVDALCAEMVRASAVLREHTVTSVFVGGGTPTVLSTRQLEQLFATIGDNFRLAVGCEITCEANPGTVDRTKFAILREMGVTRLSMGVQSFQPDELAFLGRIHTVADVYRAYESAHTAGFDNINLDFIFGLPHQPPAYWQDTLAKALTLAPEHLSLYSLIVEPETPLYHWVQTGRVDPPDDDEAADLYEIAIEQLGAAGYRQYEVSNWARRRADDGEMLPADACRHNLVYWHNDDYLGIGPGAHSHQRVRENDDAFTERRWANCRPVLEYIKRIRAQTSAEAFTESIDARMGMGETMMLGLRLLEEGVAFDRFRARHDADLRDGFKAELALLKEQDLIELDDERVRLSSTGLMMGNQVFARFLPD